MMRPRVLVGVVAALALALLAPAAQSSVRCHQSKAGDVLRVEPYADPNIDLDFAWSTLRRDGERILVLASPFDSAREATVCKGSRATPANTASVLFLQAGLSFGEIDLSGGLPAPLIEFRALIGSLAYGTVKGTDGNDDWVLAGDADSGGVSLDPGQRDRFEVLYTGLGENVVMLEPREGNDRIDASAYARRTKLNILRGGLGADTIIGSRYPDAIDGGRGRDVLDGGEGRDTIDSSDRSPDQVDCGPGFDTAAIDKHDSVTGCEKVRREGRKGKRRLAAAAESNLAPCDKAAGGSGVDDWRQRTITAGSVSVFKQPLAHMTRTRNGLITKMPMLIHGEAPVTVSVPPRLHGRVFLYYGNFTGRDGQPTTTINRAHGYEETRFEPCHGRPRTPFPGGIRVKGTAPIQLTIAVEGEGESYKLRLGKPQVHFTPND